MVERSQPGGKFVFDRRELMVGPVFSDWPFAITYAVFFAGAMARANLTYWVGFGARRGGERTRWARHLESRLVRQAETVVARYGAPAVALSFLTVGVQSAVNLAAGVLRMPLWRYEIGAVVGALMWAAIYSTVGFAVIEAWVRGAGVALWGWLAAAVIGIGLTIWLSGVARRRLEKVPEAADDLTLR